MAFFLLTKAQRPKMQEDRETQRFARANREFEQRQHRREQEYSLLPSGFKIRCSLMGHSNQVNEVAWSPGGLTLASCSRDATVRLWEPQAGQMLQFFTDPTGKKSSNSSTNTDRETHEVNGIAWSPDGQILASCSQGGVIRLWNPQTGNIFFFEVNSSSINGIAWSPDGLTLASCSADKTIRLWNPQTGKHVMTLEGHTKNITGVSFSYNGLLLASKSYDESVRLWQTDTGAMIVSIYESSPKDQTALSSLSFHPKLPVLATLSEKNTAIRIWDIDFDVILNTLSTTLPLSYTNAKVVLVGDTGVGKSGLGLVLSGQKFTPTESTHGRRIWTFSKEEVELDDKRKEIRETLLWDLAGQPGYRLIHQLHLDEVVVGLVVFDAQSETDPFAGVKQWDRALRQAQRIQGSTPLPLRKILVAARSDRGSIGVSEERIQLLVKEMGFDGYYMTSAKEGWGIPELQLKIRRAIDWEMLPRVSSTWLFQHIKNFLITEKEAGRYLTTEDSLYSSYLRAESTFSEVGDLQEQFGTCIGRVEAAGLIKRLTFGNLVLLQPELLDAYASALISVVRDEPDGLGSIKEERVRLGDFRMPHDERLEDKEQERLLLIAMVEDLLRREVVLREEPFLVFPSQSTRENPDLPDPEGKAVIFTFEGAIVNIYATLSVRLSYSGLFRKKELWRNAITYSANLGGVCGMFLRNIDEGHGELTLFFDKETSEETRLNFEEFVRIHLLNRALQDTVKRRRIFACSGCGFIVTDQLVQLVRARNANSLICPIPGCNTHISLLDREERLIAYPSLQVLEMDRTANEQRDREVAKSTVQGKIETKDFDVFLCYNNLDKLAVKNIGLELKEHGILPWLDDWELRPGLPWQRVLEEQIEHIKAAAVFVGRDGRGPWQDIEISAIIRQFAKKGCPVIPVILPGCEQHPDLPIFLEGMTWVDFRERTPKPIDRLIWGITGQRPEDSE